MMTEKKIHIMLVDDHLLFREGMVSLLSRDERFEILGEADDGIGALEKVEETMPDIVLMDVKMPNMDGIEATGKLLEKYPDLKVIMITASEKDEDLFEAVKAGAQGYILKTVTDSTFMRDAICRVAEGDAIIPPAMAPRLLNEFSTLSRGIKKEEKEKPLKELIEEKEISLLTPRENEVLELVAQGLSNKEIAKRLVISVNTVRSHLRFILDKLHMNNRVQAALWYQEKKTS
ncbi:MAG: response regulator transcription factor [Anaerolineae bacterium]|nr:response regulator transcription factor [Anaerolineae bacterium]MBT7781975.1 response regulator transcription factor [Anaerolineae bacterium]